MPKLAYDLANLVGLAAITGGLWLQYGPGPALMGSGTLVLAINQITLRLIGGKRG